MTIQSDKHKRRQFRLQLLGTAGLVDGRASDRNCLCMAIRLVTRVRDRLSWRHAEARLVKYGSEASLDADLTYAMNQSTDEAWRRDPRL